MHIRDSRPALVQLNFGLEAWVQGSNGIMKERSGDPFIQDVLTLPPPRRLMVCNSRRWGLGGGIQPVEAMQGGTSPICDLRYIHAQELRPCWL